MHADPPQREWLLHEEQERLRWKQKLQRQPRLRPHWVLTAAAAVILIIVVAVVASSHLFDEVLARFR